MSLDQHQMVRAKLSLQRALLGEVSDRLRAVAFSLSDQGLSMRFYFDGLINPVDAESVSCVEAQVLADYTADDKVVTSMIRCDMPQPVQDSGIWVYKRREGLGQ